MTRRMSATLQIRSLDGQNKVCCEKCGHALGPNGEPWKPNAVLDETPMKDIAGTTYSTAQGVMLRRFSCPGCGTLLDAETALPGAPFLDDVVFVS